jgi:hypothetical protein
MRSQLIANLEQDDRRRMYLFAQALDHQVLVPWIERDPAAFAASIKSAAHVIAMAKTLKEDHVFDRECGGVLELAARHPEARKLFAALVRADQDHPDGDRLADPARVGITRGRLDHLLARIELG